MTRGVNDGQAAEIESPPSPTFKRITRQVPKEFEVATVEVSTAKIEHLIARDIRASYDIAASTEVKVTLDYDDRAEAVTASVTITRALP